MPTLQTYLEYIDPTVGTWRSGRPGDEYKSRIDSLPVINSKITLLEMPSESHKVMISGFSELSLDQFRRKKSIAENEFFVDYTTGIVQFHRNNEGKTFTLTYHGKGLIVIPASRIYTMIQKNPDVIITLQDYIDELKIYIQQLDLKMDETIKAIQDAIQATAHANLAADHAVLATEEAIKATDDARKAAESTLVIRKDPVDTFDDLIKAYPSPENGWQVTLNSTADIYRFNSQSGLWELVGNFLGGSIPNATDQQDGLLSKEDFSKLRRIDEKTYSKRVLVFVLPTIEVGIQPIIARLPFKGRVIGARALCGTRGGGDTIISIESSSDMVNWQSILASNIVILDNQYFDDGTGSLSNVEVPENTLFRLDVLEVGTNVQNITLEVIIETTI